MNRRGFRDDAPPWSFFLPVTLAVVLGVLIADAIGLAIGAIFVRDSVEAVVPTKTPPAQASAALAEAETGDAPAPASDASAATQDEPSNQDQVPALPGPISAMRDRDTQACINGTIAERRPNGWEQGLENDAPMRCTAVSP